MGEEFPNKVMLLKNKLEILSEIGRGTFGRVVLVRNVETNENLAVKILNKILMEECGTEQVKNEINAMKLRHSNIVKINRFEEDEDNFYIFMEYVDGCDLLSVLMKLHNGFDEVQTRIIFTQILNAIDYAHQNSIIHRDLKLENILLDKDAKVLICDWGFSGTWQSGKTQTSSAGSIPYASPQICFGMPYEGPDTDVWSLGVLLYTMVSSYFPFFGESALDKIRIAQYKELHHISVELKNLIYQMLRPDPNDRITIKEILVHPWIRSKRVSLLSINAIKDLQYNTKKNKQIY